MVSTIQQTLALEQLTSKILGNVYGSLCCPGWSGQQMCDHSKCTCLSSQMKRIYLHQSLWDRLKKRRLLFVENNLVILTEQATKYSATRTSLEQTDIKKISQLWRKIKSKIYHLHFSKTWKICWRDEVAKSWEKKAENISFLNLSSSRRSFLSQWEWAKINWTLT